jgi:hypothetical protein
MKYNNIKETKQESGPIKYNHINDAKSIELKVHY